VTVCELDLARDERRASGRIEDGVARLLVARAFGLEEIAVATDLLPDVLARLMALEPRPRLDPGLRLRYSPGDLARLLAEPSPVLAARGAGDPQAQAVARELVAHLHAHWRIDARWPSQPARPENTETLEVVDSHAGLWLVVPDATGVELRPITPTAVFRRLSALLDRSPPALVA